MAQNNPMIQTPRFFKVIHAFVFSALICAFSLELSANEPEVVQFTVAALPSAVPPDITGELPDGIYGLSYRSPDGEWMPIASVPILRRTRSYSAQTNLPIVFYRETGSEEEDTLQRVEVARIVLTNADSVMLLMVAGETKGTYRLYPVPDSKKHFPFGSMRALNLSGEPLLFAVRDQPLPLESGDSETVSLGIDGRAAVPVRVAFFSSAEEQWQQSWSSLTKAREDERILILLLPSDREGAPHQTPLMIRERDHARKPSLQQ